MDNKTVLAIIASFKQELNALGFYCTWSKSKDMFGPMVEVNYKSISLSYGPFQVYMIYYDPGQEEFILRHPNDCEETLPVDFADPMCYEKLVEYMDHTHHLNMRGDKIYHEEEYDI